MYICVWHIWSKIVYFFASDVPAHCLVIWFYMLQLKLGSYWTKIVMRCFLFLLLSSHLGGDLVSKICWCSDGCPDFQTCSDSRGCCRSKLLVTGKTCIFYASIFSNLLTNYFLFSFSECAFFIYGTKFVTWKILNHKSHIRYALMLESEHLNLRMLKYQTRTFRFIVIGIFLFPFLSIISCCLFALVAVLVLEGVPPLQDSCILFLY